MTKRDLMHGVQDGRTIWHESRDVPGGRSIDLALFNGQVVFANGETGTYAGVETIEMADDREPFQAYTTFVLNDGSALTAVFDGVATKKESPDRVSGTGTWTIVGGGGRFAELKGGGSFTWAVDGEAYHAEFGA